ncbi:MAG: flagellar assembly protein FliX [Alphaproteobacteria bacterium]|nr:flagellar assembly protein FliX [Alphaproteobacteria bacterium]
MKIDSTGPIRTAQGGRRPDRAGGGSDFARHLDQAGSAPQMAAARPMGGIDSILALQEVDSPGERRGRARRRGELLLDKLEELRLGLLSGTMSRDSLVELAASMRARREDCGDPRLQAVLDEIELRAAVELAKLEVSGTR